MAKNKPRPQGRRQSKTGPAIIAAGAFVALAMIALAVSFISGGDVFSPVDPLPSVADPATMPASPTVGSVVQTVTPPPDWDSLFTLPVPSTGGWNLLVLHTNDTWGYLYPCG